MSNIAIEKSSAEKPAAPAAREWEPSRMFREFFRWDPFAEMFPASESHGKFVPAFEVRETKEGCTFKGDLPGVEESDIEVRVSNNQLTVSGKRDEERSEEGDTYYAVERKYGSFLRTFTLPEGSDTDNIQAEIKNGVLRVEVPKRPEAEAKKIAVKAASPEGRPSRAAPRGSHRRR